MGVRTRGWEEAASSLDIDPRPRRRPDPLHWLWYAFWGPLPERFRTWVLYDATCSTWILRHVARLVAVAALPVVMLVVFVPGPLHLRVLTAVVAGGGGLLFAGVWINEATEHRLVRAGWQAALGPELRKRRSRAARWLATVRRL